MSLGAACYGGLRALRLPALSRRLRDAALVLCYHNVVQAEDGAGDPSLHIAAPRFERQLRWLADHYRVVPLRELVGRLAAGRSVRRLAAFTFDDGYAGVFDVAVPILKALGIPATVFLVTGAVGCRRGFWWDQPHIVETITPRRRRQWLSEWKGDGDRILAGAAVRPVPAPCRPADWDAIRARARDGIDLGSHSVTHRALPTLAEEDLAREAFESRKSIEEATGRRPEFFTYPYGLWDARAREHVRAAGYRAALTMADGLNRPGRDAWSLRRVNVPAGICDAAFEAWAAGLALPGPR